MDQNLDVEDRVTAPRQRRRKGGRTRRSRVQNIAEYVAVRALGLILRHAPIDITSWAMGALMGAMMPLTSRHRRALDHLAYAMPELSVQERGKIARNMWHNLGRVMAEAFQIDKLIAHTERVRLPADFDAQRARAQDGLIAATAHLGNWEIAGVLPRQAGIPFVGVYQALHNPYVENYLRAMREPAYPGGLFSKGPKVGHELVRLARSGAGIGLVADFRELRGVPVRFFGREATATPLPAMLARLTGKPLIAGAIIRTQGVRFNVMMEEINVPITDDRDADILDATQALHDAYERWIRLAPDQWIWTHRKWARGPDGSSPKPRRSPMPDDRKDHAHVIR